jgi:HEAT repeat protein
MSAISKLSTVWLVLLVLAAAPRAAGAAPPVDQAALDKAFETLKTYNWGDDRSALQALDDAVAASHDDAEARKNLETRLVAVLKIEAPAAGKDVVCRQLSLIGSAGAVPALSDLLSDGQLSHMARYALERMPCPEAVAALRAALAKTEGLPKVGVINSLGVRRDAESVAALTPLLTDADQEIASAAAAALGAIGNAAAAKALQDFQKTAPEALRLVVADACLSCAEQLLADGDTPGATAIYNALSSPDQPKHVRLAAVRGLLAVKGKK